MEVAVTFTARQLELLRAAREREAPGEPLERVVARAVDPDRIDVEDEPPRIRAADSLPGRGRAPVVVVQGQAACVELRRGEHLLVQQTEGGQCADVLVWGAHDPGERFSAALTRIRESVSPGLGARLWSGWPHERPLLEISADSAPGHDLLHPACTPGEYASVGAAGEPACVLVQAEAATACGLHHVDLHDPLNLWFRPTLDASGAVGWSPTPTAPGDHVELHALEDVLVIVNPCVDDVFGCAARPRGSIAVTSPTVGRTARLVGRPVETHALTVDLDPSAAEALAAMPDHARAGIVRRDAVRHALAVVGHTRTPAT